MITIRNKYLLRHAFGFKKGDPIAQPIAIWWYCFVLHGWRNWQRGYRDEDCHSLMEKLSFRPRPGSVTYLTRREMNVFKAWYKTGQPGAASPETHPEFWGSKRRRAA